MHSLKQYINLFIFLFLSILILSCSKEEDVIDDSAQDMDMSDLDEQIPDDSGNTDTPETLVLETGFTIDKERMFTNLVLSDSEYNKFLSGEGDMRMVSNKAYEYFDDDFDFIIILNVEDSQPDGLYFGLSTPAKNDIQGLGRSVWDNTAAFGSAGKLKTVIHMPRTEYIRNGPFLHEIQHYWSNHGLIPTTAGGHWGYSSVGGQLGGFDEIEDLGSNTYRGLVDGEVGFGTVANGGNSVPYSNLELYAMGLIDTDELEAVTIAENPGSTSEFGVFTADALTVLTPEDIINENGSRIPNPENAQTEFNSLVVVISRDDIPQSKIDALNSNLENFATKGDPDTSWGALFNFWKATFGKASFDFEITNKHLK
ncbi:hypothetical protein DKG77_11960 [Flagellimonas aquimarina]|uniref:Uncharacterized protein n=1 Tax=Flagellimonas aquimarina TaxID=2201895 RepID=A0A316KZ96_9FLAO|nr:hypothetical protein [Allomuricauda koreensis]PWL38936.1 hypothetical protein DKG77_11960 [Allomuricauda koreensis]